GGRLGGAGRARRRRGRLCRRRRQRPGGTGRARRAARRRAGRRCPARGRLRAARARPAGGRRGVIRGLLGEDQAMVRGALAALRALERDIEVVAQVERGDEVVAAAEAARPDVALLDVQMPGLDGLEATARLRAALPSCRVVVLTTFGRPGYL